MKYNLFKKNNYSFFFISLKKIYIYITLDSIHKTVPPEWQRETGFTIKCNEIPFQRWNTDTGYIAGIAIGEFVLKKIAR